MTVGTAVCVLGVGRSGTSLTTRILNLVGVYLGPEDGLVAGSRRANPTGFWEQHRLGDLNNRVLRHLGGGLRKPPSPPTGWETDEGLEALRVEARRLLDDIFGGHPLWGWKDIPNGLTLPFWQHLIPEMRYVICIRNPIDVAASIETWGKWETEESLSLWPILTAHAVANTAGQRRIFVSYDDYFEDWRPTVERLAKFTGCEPPSPRTEQQIEDFIESSLRHHSTPAAATLRDGRVPPEAACLYLTCDLLSRVPRTEDGAAAASTLDAIADRYARRLLDARAASTAAGLAIGQRQP